MSDELEKRFYLFALQIIELVNRLPKTTAGFEIGKQLFRSGTSIVANYTEEKGAFSKDDFVYKLNTSFKEARATVLWLMLTNDAQLIKEDFGEIVKEATEIRNILGKCVTTAKQRNVGCKGK